MIAWWKRHHGCGGEARAEWGYDDGGAYASHEDSFEGGGGPFGVRRPLRFLAYRLRLDEKQVNELAKVLAELKTERSQAAVDHRRSSGAIADAIDGDTFDDARVTAAAAQRVKSAETLRDAVVKALRAIHALLNPDQRRELAYLLRTGQLLI
jgi:Spy/CpxP family protein refolding chaperone